MSDETNNETTDTNSAPDWRSQLPEDIRDHSALADYKDIGGLAKSLIHAQSRLGNAVVIPDSDATPEALNSFYSRLGRPETPDGYEISPAEGSTVKADDPWLGEFKKKAFDLGLTKSQTAALAQELITQTDNSFAEATQAAKQAQEETMAALAKDWGGKTEERTKLAQQLVAKYGGEELQQLLTDSGLANDARLVKFAYNLAAKLQEDNVPGKGSGFTAEPAPEDARKEIDRLRGDKEFMNAYLSVISPGHKAAQDKMASLYKLAYPQGSAA